MIEHIVMWKFLENTENEREEFLKGLEGLYGVIPEIKYMEIKKKVAGEYDAVLISRFDSLSDLEKYKNDERHKKVSALCKSIRESRASIDFEI